MKKNKILYNDILFLVFVILSLLTISLPTNLLFGSDNISLYILLAISAAFVIFNWNEFIKKNKNYIFLFLFQIILLIFSILTNDGGFGSIIIIVLMDLILLSTGVIKIQDKLFKILKYLSLIFFLSMVIIKNDDINTNTAAFKTFDIFIITFCSFAIKEKIDIKTIIILIILGIIEISDALYYDCRSVLFATILIFILTLIPTSFFKKGNKNKIVWLVAGLGSIAFVFLYLYMYENGYNIDFSSFSNKKLFSGREVIWQRLFNLFKNGRYIFGIGSRLGLTNNLGAHNYMFSLLMLFGIPNFIIFQTILYKFFKKIFVSLNKLNKACMTSILALFFTGFFETTFIGSANMSVLLILIIIINTTSNLDKRSDSNDN